MTDSPLASSFVQARLYRKNPGRPLRVVVIHDMEAPEGPRTAENCAAYFAGPNAGGSAHYCVDTDSIVQCVWEADQAAHAPGTNTDGIGIELNGYARQTADEWLDDTSVATLRLAAALTADVCARRGIPARWLTDAQLADGQSKGLATHAQVSRVFKRSDHTDPGPNFPADYFVTLVQGVNKPATTPLAEEEEDMPAEIAWDPRTGRAWHIVGNTKVYLSNMDQVAALKDRGVKETNPADPRWIDACATLPRNAGEL